MSRYEYQIKRDQEMVATGIAIGNVTAWLEAFADRSQLSFAILATRVGRQLLSAAGGEVLGTEHPLPPLRRKAPKRNSAVAEVEMARRPYSRAQVKANFPVKSQTKTKPVKWERKNSKWAKIKNEKQIKARLLSGTLTKPSKRLSTGMSAYWAKMTPEERRAEMARRRAKSQSIKKALSAA